VAEQPRWWASKTLGNPRHRGQGVWTSRCMQSRPCALPFGVEWQPVATSLSAPCRMYRSYRCRRRRERRSLGLAHLVSREQRCDEHIEGGIGGRYVWRIDHEGGRRYVGRVARGKSLARVGYCCGRQMSSDLLSGRSIFALVCSVHSMLLGE
jgi:hypothetical protein